GEVLETFVSSSVSRMSNENSLRSRISPVCSKPSLDLVLLSSNPSKHRTEFIIVERDSGKIKPHKFPIPNRTSSRTFLRGSEIIFIEQCAHEFGRPIRERVMAQKPHYRLVPLQKLSQKTNEPGVLCGRREGGEPHEPVQSQVIRRDLWRNTIHITRLA